MLGRKVGQGTASNGSVGLNHFCGTEGPAGATMSLVLDIGDGSFCSPVNLCRKVLGWLRNGRKVSSIGWKVFVPTGVHCLEFIFCNVAELVDG